jgi:hypothetical protein
VSSEQKVGKMFPLCALCLSVCIHAAAAAEAAAAAAAAATTTTTTTTTTMTTTTTTTTTTTGSLHEDLRCTLKTFLEK